MAKPIVAKPALPPFAALITGLCRRAPPPAPPGAAAPIRRTNEEVAPAPFPRAANAGSVAPASCDPAASWRKPMSAIEKRLAELGVTLPDAPAPAANYVPFVVAGGLVYVSGQISQGPGGLIVGKLGRELDVAEGAAAARTCAIALVAQAKKAAGGDLDRISRVVKLTGFVNSTPEFTDQPKVVNGASDFLVELFGDKGRHARSAVSAGSLPLGVAVEIEGIFALA